MRNSHAPKDVCPSSRLNSSSKRVRLLRRETTIKAQFRFPYCNHNTDKEFGRRKLDGSLLKRINSTCTKIKAARFANGVLVEHGMVRWRGGKDTRHVPVSRGYECNAWRHI